VSAVEELNRREADYLLSIFLNSKSKGYARHSEVVKELRVSKPTASLMVKKLTKKKFVASSRKGVRLTERGRAAVAELLWRHGVIEAALSRLGVSAAEACKVTWEIELLLPGEVVEVIWRALGAPCVCPCGVRFPTIDEKTRLEDYEACGFPSASTNSARNPKR